MKCKDDGQRARGKGHRAEGRGQRAFFLYDNLK